MGNGRFKARHIWTQAISSFATPNGAPAESVTRQSLLTIRIQICTSSQNREHIRLCDLNSSGRIKTTVPFNPTDRAFGEYCYSNPERLGTCIRSFETAIRKFLDGSKPQPPFISNPSSFRYIYTGTPGNMYLSHYGTQDFANYIYIFMYTYHTFTRPIRALFYLLSPACTNVSINQPPPPPKKSNKRSTKTFTLPSFLSLPLFLPP